jgi:uncharacterized phage protein (TIGR01671 family)
MIPKFRAWHKKFKQMVFVSELNLKDDWPDAENITGYYVNDKGEEDYIGGAFDEFELMQWTGMSDDVQRDVYVGDILQLEWPDKVRAFEVRGTGNHGYYDIKSHSGGDAWPLNGLSTRYDCMACKVIGNIYENKELVEVKGGGE